jgi:glycosyltransferase involved in cell wall biosynthesis
VPAGFEAQTRRGNFYRDCVFYELFKDLYRAAAATEPQVVLVPYLDYCLHTIAVRGAPFGGLPWAGVALRPSFHYAAMGIRAPHPTLAWLRAAVFRRLLAAPLVRRCFTIDEPLALYARKAFPAVASKLEFMPDPVAAAPLAGRVAARERFGIPTAAVTVLLYGRVGDRKGLGPLLDAVARAAPLSQVHVLIVGEPDESAALRLGSASAQSLRSQGRLHEHKGWASAAVEADAFAASDIVWLGYEGHWQSSGVLIQAGLAAKPVLACDQGIIAWHTERHRCGLVAQVSNADSVVTALARLAASETLRSELGSHGQSVARNYSVNAAVNLLDRSLRQVGR